MYVFVVIVILMVDVVTPIVIPSVRSVSSTSVDKVWLSVNAG